MDKFLPILTKIFQILYGLTINDFNSRAHSNKNGKCPRTF